MRWGQEGSGKGCSFRQVTAGLLRFSNPLGSPGSQNGTWLQASPLRGFPGCTIPWGWGLGNPEQDFGLLQISGFHSHPFVLLPLPNGPAGTPPKDPLYPSPLKALPRFASTHRTKPDGPPMSSTLALWGRDFGVTLSWPQFPNL